MSWLVIALIPPFLWAISNHIDKYLLSKYFHSVGIGPLMIFSSIIAVPMLFIVTLINPDVLTTFHPQNFIVIFSGILYLLALFPYLKALSLGDSSLVIPLFQMGPIITYVLSWIILGESLSKGQVIGGLVVIVSSIFIALDLGELRKFKMRWDIVGYMLLASILFSFNSVLFKLFALSSHFWMTSFYEYIGFVLFGIVLFFIPKYRIGFFKVFEDNRTHVLSTNSVNEIVNIIGKLAFNYASLLVPIALVNVVGSVQPLFVFLIGIIITLFFPRIGKEDVSRRTIIQRLLAISFMALGAYLLSRVG